MLRGAAIAGPLAATVVRLPPHVRVSKGVVGRLRQFLDTFLHACLPVRNVGADFNHPVQWLADEGAGGARTKTRPLALLDTDRSAMLPLPASGWLAQPGPAGTRPLRARGPSTCSMDPAMADIHADLEHSRSAQMDGCVNGRSSTTPGLGMRAEHRRPRHVQPRSCCDPPCSTSQLRLVGEVGCASAGLSAAAITSRSRSSNTHDPSQHTKSRFPQDCPYIGLREPAPQHRIRQMHPARA